MGSGRRLRRSSLAGHSTCSRAHDNEHRERAIPGHDSVVCIYSENPAPVVLARMLVATAATGKARIQVRLEWSESGLVRGRQRKRSAIAGYMESESGVSMVSSVSLTAFFVSPILILSFYLRRRRVLNASLLFPLTDLDSLRKVTFLCMRWLLRTRNSS